MKRFRLSEVARIMGFDYSSLRTQVKKREEILKAKGLLAVEESLVNKKYYVLVEPKEFIERLRKIIRGEDE